MKRLAELIREGWEILCAFFFLIILYITGNDKLD
jgi:hypothetical protein